MNVIFLYTPFRHRQRLETLLKELTPSREDIASAMLFCLDRADAAEEVVGHITDSFSLLQTPLQKKASYLPRVFIVILLYKYYQLKYVLIFFVFDPTDC